MFNEKKYLFFDIETTGLSPDVSAITLIGCCHFDGTILQWFNEDGFSQKEILKDFLDYIVSYDTLISYNGTTFDLPFLESKIREYHLDNPLDHMEHIDLYQVLSPFRHLFPMKRFRQKDLENYLGIIRKDNLTGKKIIKTYQVFLETGNTELKELLLLHNREDLTGLVSVSSLTCYLSLEKGEFQISRCKQKEDCLEISISLKQPWSKPSVLEKASMILSIKDTFATFTCYYQNGLLKHYYPNPEDYYYLPEEDIVLPKAMGSMVDKSIRIPATADKCYSKFVPGKDFVNHNEDLYIFCKHNIYYLLRKEHK
ncbi:ribonuclease H-like domain-containing protein [Anaerostipes faecalis]|uniref:ribonuclease H-like domain-containing protein n=1 Tax=Anaerostipes faecalis TaxID=2738446 RepID=UPI003F111ACC